jgi:hypothetical protein
MFFLCFPQKRKNQIRQLTDPAVLSSVNEYCCGQGSGAEKPMPEF